MAARITLTKTALASDAGYGLLSLLKHVTADGELSLGDVQGMRAWLQGHLEAVDVPAVAWLRELVELVLADGRVTAAERVELLVAIERVLPMDERILAKKRRQVAEQQAGGGEATSAAATHRRDRPATENQIAYLEALGASDLGDLTVAQASAKIEQIVGQRGESPSNRQLMVLRFWNRLDVAKGGSRGASEWMEEFYREDPDHREAWEHWKREHPDCQRGQGDPTVVPIGAGIETLKRLKASPADASPAPRSGMGAFFVLAVVAAAIWLIINWA